MDTTSPAAAETEPKNLSPNSADWATAADWAAAYYTHYLGLLVGGGSRLGDATVSASVMSRNAVAHWGEQINDLDPVRQAETDYHAEGIVYPTAPATMPAPPPTLGDRIKAYRSAHGLSQQKFANHAGIDQSMVSRIEADTKKPDVETLRRLAIALAVSLDELAGVTPPAGTGTASGATASGAMATERGTAESVTVIVPFGETYPSPLNPRRHMDDNRIDELAASIAAMGLLQPPTGRRGADGRIEIYIGGTRWAALNRLATSGAWPADKLPDSGIPVVLRQVDDVSLVKLALAENVNRDAMHPMDEALAFCALLDRTPGLTIAHLAHDFGKQPRWMQERVRAARNAAPALSEAFYAGQVRWDQVRALTRYPTKSQTALLSKYPDLNNWTTERAVGAVVSTFPFAHQALFEIDAYAAAGGGFLDVRSENEDDDKNLADEDTDDGEGDTKGDRAPDCRRLIDIELFTRLQREAIEQRIAAATAAGITVEQVEDQGPWWTPWEKPRIRRYNPDPALGGDPAQQGCRRLIVLVPRGQWADARLFDVLDENPAAPAPGDGGAVQQRDPVQAIGPARIAAAGRTRTAALQDAVAGNPVVALARVALALLGWSGDSRLMVDWGWPDNAAVAPAVQEQLAVWTQRLGYEFFDAGDIPISIHNAGSRVLTRLRPPPLSGPHQSQHYTYHADGEAARAVWAALLTLTAEELATLIGLLGAARLTVGNAYHFGVDWLAVETAHAAGLDMEQAWRIDGDYLSRLKIGDLDALRDHVNGWCRSHRQPEITDDDWNFVGEYTKNARRIAKLADKREILLCHINACNVRLVPPEIEMSPKEAIKSRLTDGKW